MAWLRLNTLTDSRGREVPSARFTVAKRNFVPPTKRDLLRLIIVEAIAVFTVAIGAFLADSINPMPDHSLLGFAAILVAATLSYAGFIVLAVYPISWILQRFSYQPFVQQMANQRRCASCDYDLSNLKPDPDGHTTCPECSACWKLP